MLKKINKSGLTLVEVIISLAILGIIIIPLSSLFLNSVKNNVRSEDQLKANQLAQEKMEEIMHKNVLSNASDTETEDDFTIAYSIEDMAGYGGVANTTGTLVTDYDAEVSLKDLPDTIDIDLSDEDAFIYIIIENNTITFSRVPEADEQSDTVNFVSADDVKIKVYCDNEEEVTLKIYNRLDIPARIYKIYEIDQDTDEEAQVVNIQTESGRVYAYESIYDQADDSEEKYKAYKITVSVMKAGKELARIVSLKTLD